jgi:hypothetical protein
MANGQTTDGIVKVTRDARISASNRLWGAFNEWMEQHGYTTLTEGIRAAMVEVTQFDLKSQDKNTAAGQ